MTKFWNNSHILSVRSRRIVEPWNYHANNARNLLVTTRAWLIDAWCKQTSSNNALMKHITVWLLSLRPPPLPHWQYLRVSSLVSLLPAPSMLHLQSNHRSWASTCAENEPARKSYIDESTWHIDVSSMHYTERRITIPANGWTLL